MRNKTAPFFTGRFGSTATSMTCPRTCGTMLTTYLMTRTSADDGATTFSVRIRAVRPTIGMVITVTIQALFHGSHLNLKKISQTKNA
jgi:hypothetical protein